MKILSYFAKTRKVTIPLLSDPGSKVIKKFDIHKGGGLPFPGTYVIDRRGLVVSKDFRESYKERIGMDSLVTELGADPTTQAFTAKTAHLNLSVRASTESVRPGSVFSLVYEVKMKPKIHIYAPEVKGYIPVSVELEKTKNVRTSKTSWPKSKPYHFKALNETVPVYEKTLRIVQEITATTGLKSERGKSGKKVVVFAGTFNYQACDDKTCFRPQSVPFRVEIPYKGHDWKKVPKSAK